MTDEAILIAKDMPDIEEDMTSDVVEVQKIWGEADVLDVSSGIKSEGSKEALHTDEYDADGTLPRLLDEEEMIDIPERKKLEDTISDTADTSPIVVDGEALDNSHTTLDKKETKAGRATLVADGTVHVTMATGQ